MTEMKYETDLFGPLAPFVDHEKGSPLNNFLCAMSGRKAIVLLDEFEKSSKEVWDSLLILFDEGSAVYPDHSNGLLSPI
jgi:ATP-dependent Clp protease ATP-binding subunit ClpA